MSNRSRKTASTDLYSNKDALLTISTFLSLKQLNMLREISKQFNSWLSDYSSFSWKNRIELSFPTTFQQVLKEDVNTQINRLQKFDSLVDSGHQVSFFSTQSLLKHTSAVEVNAKYQVPWSRNLFVIVFNKTSVVVFDAATGKDTCRVDFFEMKSIDTVLFDIQNTKAGFVNKETGTMKLFSLADNSLKFESDFICDQLKPSYGCQLIPQIYGDYIIISKAYSTKLAWYSLSSGKSVREIEVAPGDGVYIAPSIVDPVLYISETMEDMYTIHCVDCLLSQPELDDRDMIDTEYSGFLDIFVDNGGDGVDGMELIETEDGSVFNVYLLGTGDRGYEAIKQQSDETDETDETNETVFSLHFNYAWFGYKTIKYNPGSDFYSLKKAGVVAIMNSKMKYDDEKCDVEGNATDRIDADGSADDDDECSHNGDGEGKKDPTEGAYFKFNSKTEGGKWLNKDLFTVKSFYKVTKEVEPEPDTKPSKARGKSKKGVKRQAKAVKQEPKIITEIKSRQVFFSIAKRAIIGSIDDDINDVFIAGNKIVAFTAQGDIYRVVLDDTYYHSTETKQDDEKKEIPNDVKGPKMELVNTKKRKLSEQDAIEDESRDVEEPPKKKHKMECCCV